MFTAKTIRHAKTLSILPMVAAIYSIYNTVPHLFMIHLQDHPISFKINNTATQAQIGVGFLIEQIEKHESYNQYQTDEHERTSNEKKKNQRTTTRQHMPPSFTYPTLISAIKKLPKESKTGSRKIPHQ